jgi:predicted enzyme related to lactoylglutathione lyase
MTMDMKLELVPVPVADVDRAKAFYVDQIGFNADFDHLLNESTRLCQLTPPGSACSILLSTGLPEISAMLPGTHKGLHLVVKDARAARELLVSRGVAVSNITEYPRGIKIAHFADPDGNTWELQEIPPGV